MLQHCSIASKLQHTCMNDAFCVTTILRGRGSPGSWPSCIWGPGLLTISVSACCSSRRASVQKRGRGRLGLLPGFWIQGSP